ncbi:MAG: hypothetical protein WC889_12605, partial [Myxococcota bacterium]|jgi:hypothetical protein
VSITLDLFRIAGLMNADNSAKAIDIYAAVTCSNIETFGQVLGMLGLCNPGTGKMILNGTANLEPHPGTEGKRPEGVSVMSVKASKTGGKNGGGYVEAAFSGNPGKAADHLPVIVLLDVATGEPLNVDLGLDTEKQIDGDGVLTGVRLNLPKTGVDPFGRKAVVTYDLFPLVEEIIAAK